jgi:hypothetical protein
MKLKIRRADPHTIMSMRGMIATNRWSEVSIQTVPALPTPLKKTGWIRTGERKRIMSFEF